jgi:hypothetical protein
MWLPETKTPLPGIREEAQVCQLTHLISPGRHAGRELAPDAEQIGRLLWLHRARSLRHSG